MKKKPRALRFALTFSDAGDISGLHQPGRRPAGLGHVQRMWDPDASGAFSRIEQRARKDTDRLFYS